LVPNIIESTNIPPKTAGKGYRNPETSIMEDSSPVAKQISTTSSLADIRVTRETKQLSKTAETLILQSRALGTRNRYSSAWEKFRS